MNPLISIVIPSNNRTELLDEAIVSIITDPSWNSDCELCISDNSKGDGTQNLIRTKYIIALKLFIGVLWMLHLLMRMSIWQFPWPEVNMCGFWR